MHFLGMHAIDINIYNACQTSQAPLWRSQEHEHHCELQTVRSAADNCEGLRDCSHALTIGIPNAVYIGHRLAALVQDVHLLADRHKASSVCLGADGCQVQALQVVMM